MASRLTDADCPRCGGRSGIGGVPLVMFQGRFAGSEHHTYNAEQRCPRCGAAPPLVVDFAAPDVPGADPGGGSRLTPSGSG